eukprot:3941993-Rhodomonas_salina.5
MVLPNSYGMLLPGVPHTASIPHLTTGYFKEPCSELGYPVVTYSELGYPAYHALTAAANAAPLFPSFLAYKAYMQVRWSRVGSRAFRVYEV